MTDHDALLAAIIANRADDTPRLVFADWCEENGQPERGEFIRVQVEKNTLNPSLHRERCNCKGCQLRRRERELLDEHRGEWFRLLNRRPGFGENALLRWWPVASNEDERLDRGDDCPVMSEAMEGDPTRGFVSSLTCSWSDWRTHAAAILARQPIERVKLTDYPFQQANVVPGRTRDELELELLRLRWPGIEFELPPEPIVVTDWSAWNHATFTVQAPRRMMVHATGG